MPESGPGDWLALNRALWDERVPIHLEGDFYGVDRFLSGRSTLRAFEALELGDVRGCSLVHPQCHFGLDTLSLARLGATVTGLDFSPEAVQAARDVARRANLEAEFVCANVYDAVAALGARRFDVVYTGLGAINWLPDIERWAATMAALVAPGGRFYLVEFHPIVAVFADDSLSIAHPYFDRTPQLYDEPGTYADLEAVTVHNRSVEWTHGLGDVVSALAAQGLRIEMLHEHDFTLFPRFPFLKMTEERTYHMPPGMPSLPLMYSLRARPS